MRRLMLLLCLFGVMGFVMTGCKKEQKPPEPAVEEKKEEPKPEEPKAEEPKAEEPKKEEAPAAGDKLGIPECDDYLDKYTACLKDKVPEASRGMMEKSLAMTRDAWKKAAETEAGKTGLAAACKTASEAASKAMTAFGCKW